MTPSAADSAPLVAYDNRTVHVRFAPYRRRFSFRLLQLFADVDRIGEAAAGLALFAYNRPGVFSFHDRDHGPMDGGPLGPWARALFARHGVSLDGGPVRLLCFPRTLGYVFNPLSVYFGYGPDGGLRGVIYEVRNTFGEHHCYVAPAPLTPHGAPKQFHVSPFFAVTGDYRFTLRAPDAHFALKVENMIDGACAHLATLSGVRKPMTDGLLARTLLAKPFNTLAAVAGIHWHALFIWLRGARYHARPPLPASGATPAPPLAAREDVSRLVGNG